MAHVNNNCYRNGGHCDFSFKRPETGERNPAWLAQFPHIGHALIAQYPRARADLINSFLPLSTAHNAE
jgi:hypothetical protein